MRTMKKGQVQAEVGRGLGCRGPMSSRGLGRWLLWFMGFCVFVTVFLVTRSKSWWLFCAPPHPTQKAFLPPEPPASHLADSAGLSSHKAEEPRPERYEAAAAGEEIRHHTECLSPSSRGLVHLWERRGQKSSSEPMETTFNQFPHPHLSQEAGGPHLSQSC